LLIQLDDLWEAGIATVVAPAGSGKTTLLHQWAEMCAAPVAWITAESSVGSSCALLNRLGQVLSVALETPVPTTSIDALLTALAEWTGQRAVLVVDDVHAIEGTEAERTLRTIVRSLPLGFVFLTASRRTPDLGLSRLRVANRVLEFGVDDLRFRAWETEALFAKAFDLTMLPEEAASLTRRTAGWAAGLQLFNLAVRNKSRSERVRMLECFNGGSRTVAEYLADNVMDDLPAELAEFLIRTSPQRILTPSLCDAFLDRDDSRNMLLDLEQRELFLLSTNEGTTFAYHEILRSYLDGLLTARLGEVEARAEHYRAARLLLHPGPANEEVMPLAGAVSAALAALCRAEAWSEAVSLLASQGDELATDDVHLMDVIPGAMIESDPWLQLAMARRFVASGNLDAAVAAYRRCQQGLPTAMAARTRQEQMAVANWTHSIPSPAPGWSYRLRRAVAGESTGEWDVPAGENELASVVAAALLQFRNGHMAQARDLLTTASRLNESPLWDLGIRITHLLASLLAEQDCAERDRLARRCLPLAAEADRLGVPWLSRLSHSLMALAGQTEMAEAARIRCIADGDQWGELFIGIIEAGGRLMEGEAPIELLSDTMQRARTLGAGALEAIALGEMAMAQAAAQMPDARQIALSAEAFGRRVGVPCALALSHFALARGGQDRDEHIRQGIQYADECGIGLARCGSVRYGTDKPARHLEHQDDGPGKLRITCFGGMQLERDGDPVDDGCLRPRARALLAMLAMHDPQPVHVEVLIENLWAEANPDAANHRLHTAVSSIRRLLGAAEAEVVRRGEAYALRGVRTDVAEFALDCERAQQARRKGDVSAETQALRNALVLHCGELLGEFGPAEWVVRERERLAQNTVDAADRLAVLELANGNTPGALWAARRGLDIDRYRESLWLLAEQAATAACDHAMAVSFRNGHSRALEELGVTVR
jgi:DNA-binding SARP family transcriptional activator